MGMNKICTMSKQVFRLRLHFIQGVFKSERRKMSDTVTVSVAQGRLCGKQATLKSGHIYYSFKGIPYAKPPVGSLRFMAPQEPEPWTGVRTAFKEGNVCPHKDMFFQNLIGEEDCLFLNIYTKTVLSDEAPRPVMVWFHGGGFNVGHGNSDMYGPELLLTEDIVLVTLNYRIGVLGFLSISDGGVSGNAGLKDQVAALRWIKQNISPFGGDPNNVTIFGESAGGACVHHHLLSQMSEGLFHRAISQSGSALSWWALVSPPTARQRAFTIGEILGFKTNNPKELVHFLRRQPAYDLVKAMSITISKERRLRGDLFPFVPTIESGSCAEEIFLSDSPQELIEAGRINQVPYMTGINSHEGIYMLRELILNPSKWSKLESNFQNVIPVNVNIKLNTKQFYEVETKMRNFYLKGKPLSEETIENYVHIISDTWFKFPVDQTVKKHTTFSKSPVYYFQFSYCGELGFYKNIVGANHLSGACHGDELGYLFNMLMLQYEELDPQSTEITTVKRMVKMWTNFAKTGNPTPELSELLPVKWEPSSPSNHCYLDIGNKLELKRDPEKERMQFMEKLYQETGKIYPACQL